MSDGYYVRVRGRTLGPYPLDAIRQMVRKAQIGRSHEVSVDGVSWTSATTFPEIFERAHSAVIQTTSSGGAAGADLWSGVDANDPGVFQVGQSPPQGGGSPAPMWHYTMSGQQQQAPVDQHRLVELISMGHVGPDDNVWRETMSEWLPVSHVPELAVHAMPPAPRTNQPAGFPINGTPQSQPFATDNMSLDYQRFVGKKTGAGVAALLLGTIGIHKFMLGLTTGGLTMLLLTLLVIPIPVLSIIAFVEGILYLTKNDQQFFQDYAVDRKQWF